MEKSICRYDVSMRKLLEAINEAPAGIAFVTDDEGKLCGVVTDGDFRRLLLGGKSLDESLNKKDLGKFVYAREGASMESLLKLADKNIRTIPLVDEAGRPVSFFRYEHRLSMIPVAEPDLKGNEFKYLSDAFLSTWISSRGEYIDRLENNFSKFCGCSHGVAVSNGTVAIHLALLALNIGPGDEVIVPDLTFAATINTVLHAGATPVIVDVDLTSWCIDPVAIEKAITPKTKAIIPVHVYGQPCDMDAIMSIATMHNLFVIEDCAEAHGAIYKGKPVGSFGIISCYSFFANKIITTGEGGMCLTNDPRLNDRMRVLRDHGMNKTKRYWHDEVGFNYRMTNLQAAIGVAQLERIESIIAERRRVEEQYRIVLKDFPFIKWQADITDRKRVVWLVCIELENRSREELFAALSRNGVDVRPFFYPLSDMEVYRKFVHSSGRSGEISKRGLNLPTVSQIDYSKVLAAFREIG
jgi:perosamine synthetase